MRRCTGAPALQGHDSLNVLWGDLDAIVVSRR